MSAEADSERRLALKRKAEGDLDDSGDPEVEDSVIISLAKLWHQENDPDDEVDLLILQQRDYFVDIDDTLLKHTLVEKARAEKISVIRELGVLEVVDRPCDEVVFGTRWVDFNKGYETKPFYRSRLVVQDYKRQADWSFFTATPPLEALRSLLICATIDELPNEVGQPVAWTEPVVLVRIDVRRAHFHSAARRKVFVELPAEADDGKGKVGRLPRSVYGCRDAGVNWEFPICGVMIAIGFVQGRASPCIYRHLEGQLRVWVHGDDFVPLGYTVNVRQGGS